MTCYCLNSQKYMLHNTEDKLIFGDAEFKIMLRIHRGMLTTHINAGVSSKTETDLHFIDK